MSMGRVFQRSFRIRHYECDAYGHLNNANYLRFMQETATDASADVGFDIERYRQLGTIWLIHESEIEYLRPIQYNQVVNVRTWVSDFRRVTSRRDYEFNDHEGQIYARAYTIWAYLEAETQSPAQIPEEMMAAFSSPENPMNNPQRKPYPKIPGPPEVFFKMRRKVSWHDIDGLGHVNNAVYLEYADGCGFQDLEAHGWPVEQMTAEGKAILLRKNHILYREPARLGDELEISTWVANLRRSSATRYYQICRARDEALLAEIQALGVWVDLKTGLPERFPAQFLEDYLLSSPRLTS
jgi:acyl-CoA thioester hydrolase